MHSSIEITDETYSNLTDGEVQKRIASLGKNDKPDSDNQEMLDLLKEFLLWMKRRKLE